jgi:hypothetical protein
MPVTEDNTDGMTLLDFFYPNRPPKFRVSPKSLGRHLKKYRDDPVPQGKRILTLQVSEDPHMNTLVFSVKS